MHNNFKSDFMKKKTAYDWWYLILLSIPMLAMGAVTILIFISLTNFKWYVDIAFVLIVFLPAIIVINNIKAQNKDLNSYLTLLFFYSSSVIAIIYFKPIPHGLEIPKLKPGTVGFRTNNAEVEIRSIRIWYQDSLDDWKEIPTDSINKFYNWLKPIKPYSNDKSLGSIKCKHQGEDRFIIKNCAILFKPISDSISAKFSNVRVEAIIKFISAKGENPGFSIITNRSIKSKTYKNDSLTKILSSNYWKDTYNYHFDIEDLCLEFVFPFENNAHPWIPALEWMPGIIQSSSFLDVEQSFLKNEKVKKCYTDYKLSAFVFDDQVRFTVLADGYKGVKCLFEAKIEK